MNRAPTLEEQRQALLDAWLGVRQYITPTRFRAIIRGNERRVCAHQWGELRGIWSRYETTLATVEGRTDAGRRTRHWAALEAWALDERDGPALPELAGYDPTAGNECDAEIFAGAVAADDPDYPWGKWLDPDAKELVRLIDETDLGNGLKEAGWFQQPSWMSHPEVMKATGTTERNVICADSLLHRVAPEELEKAGE